MCSGWNFTTNVTGPDFSDRQSNPNAFLFQFFFGSSVYMSVISFTTVLANSLLLVVFWLDPSKTFRNPASFFLAALGLVDLVTGLVQEPIYASCFMLGYFKYPAAKRHCPKLLQIGRIVAITSMNASFIIVLAFTATQLLAITAPFTYAALVTRAKVIAAVAGIYAYCILFGLLYLIQFPDPNTLSQVDLFLHSFFLVYLTIAIYIILYRAFRRRMDVSRSLRSDSSLRQNISSVQRTNDRRVSRKFVAVNFSLVCLVFFCTQPSALLQLLNLFWFDNTPRLNMLIASLMVDNLLYLKFALDPFIYAWRLPKYRKALRIICCSETRFVENKEANPAELAFPRANKSTETVVALSFRCLADDQCAEGTTQ